jgi:hypothetical protein
MDSYAKRNPNLAWTLGTDFNYGSDDRFYLNFQYAGKFVRDYDYEFFTDYTNGAPDVSRMADPEYVKEYYYRNF